MQRIPPALLAGALLALMSTGCCCKKLHCRADVPAPAPIGTISDSIWQMQESNAEASDFVVHEHEFIGNTARLNAAGEEHVKRIAVRSRDGAAPFPILIEPSSMSPRPGDKYGYAIHNDPELDLKRREVIVHALTQMGVADADRRVVVSPALTPGFEQIEAERAYQQGFGGARGMGFGGFGGFGIGGGVGFGGLGGGGIF